VGSWLLSGLLVGEAIIIAYGLVLRYDLTVPPAAVAVAGILGQIRQAVVGSHPAALPGGIGAAGADRSIQCQTPSSPRCSPGAPEWMKTGHFQDSPWPS
jgi:hypothetical protein